MLAFECTDAGGAAGEAWRVRLEPDGLRPVPDGENNAQAASAAVRGPAADLLLLLYGRRIWREPVFDVSGDTALLDHWFAHAAF
ncbi:hypothetical protein [Streptomyces sp. NPDC094022]|uniref:hypothetical protein n=1 Tax=Streptomyces sp. NPDC094022 TaxID=3155206 RepID=UPI0011CD4B53|nr:hypothetical protein [Streptomyces lavendulae]TXJ79162.1 hypothetical protein E2C11_13075 [Streptomyces lavendulae]